MEGWRTYASISSVEGTASVNWEQATKATTTKNVVSNQVRISLQKIIESI